MKLYAFVISRSNGYGNETRRVALGVGDNEQQAANTVPSDWAEYAVTVFEVQATELG